MRDSDYPHLKNYIGQDLVLTDGTTLLGADDKAAIAAIMTMAEYLILHPEVKHGPVHVAFTPDEEVSRLAENLDLNRFGAQIAYTVDGDYVGYYSYETFNGTEAQLSIHGLNVHPGTAKDIMINAVEIASEFIDMLPKMERPYNTSGREGYFHPYDISGTVEAVTLLCLIRDHDEERFEERKEYVRKCVEKLNKTYGEGRVELKFDNSYKSMKKVVEPVFYMIDELKQAFTDCGIEPTCLAFRGGTDGANISQRGLPCPNISAGYENAHSRFEFVTLQAMEKNVEVLVQVCKNLAEKK